MSPASRPRARLALATPVAAVLVGGLAGPAGAHSLAPPPALEGLCNAVPAGNIVHNVLQGSKITSDPQALTVLTHISDTGGSTGGPSILDACMRQ